MTRLYSEIIKDIPISLPHLDRNYIRSTGDGMLILAARTTGFSLGKIKEKIKDCSAAVVPVSSGDGIIPGFAEGVRAILQYIGLKTWITNGPDVAGLGEVFAGETDLMFLADESSFLAINVQTRKVIDNDWATANGFVEALSAASEMIGDGLAGIKVLVLGLGPVGTKAAEALHKKGAKVLVFDHDPVRLQTYIQKNRAVTVVEDSRAALLETDYIFDATPSPKIIDESVIRPSSIITCPGVPHGLTSGALAKLGGGFIHDNLPLGVIVMAIQSLELTI